MLVSMPKNLDLMAAGVGNTFPTVPCAEKIWPVAGPEFYHHGKAGSKFILKEALHRIKTTHISFQEFTVTHCVKWDSNVPEWTKIYG